MKFENKSKDNILQNEAFLFTDYLIDMKPLPNIVERYIDVNRKLGIDVVISSDAKILEFVLNHPWSVHFLDAASGFLQPDALLRKKIYAMAAILEASPKYTNHFFPQSLSLPKLLVNLIANSLTAGMKIMIGIPLFYCVRGKYND